MSSFTTPLDVEYIDGRNWRVLVGFDYVSDVLKRLLVIPIGFETDFASIPRVLWNLLPPAGAYGKAAVVHDFLYRTPKLATRAQADAVFFEAMTCLGVGWWTRWVMYLGVRLGGAPHYKGGL